jgi:anti-sigma B factor antagonist
LEYSIRQETDGPGHVIAVSGEADVAAESELRAAIAAAAAGGGESHVIVDLSETSLIDSRIIGVLADWAERIRLAGGWLRVVCTNPHILRVFGVVGIEDILEVFGTRAEAESRGAA